MVNENENITLNGIEFPAGNLAFRQKFFEYSGWAISDIERICALQSRIPAEVTFSPVNMKGFGGVQIGESEKTIRRILGKPTVALHDSYWNPRVTLLIYDTYIGQLRIKLQMVLFHNRLEIAMIDPRNTMLSDQQIYKTLQHFFGPVEFFTQSCPDESENIFYIMHDNQGKTLILERYFTLRVHLLSPSISSYTENKALLIPA